MASSSSSCTHCHSTSTKPLMNGWISRNGEYAHLCPRCYSIFNAGLFCVTFHSNEDGWRDCNSCRKLFHCGCIVSLNDYSLDDFGGITCLNCSTNFLPAHRGHLNAETNPQDLVTESNSAFPPSDLIYLFEKSLSASDCNTRNSRMVIPNPDAKAFFPEISAGQIVPLSILDTDGKEWDFNYRCWFHKTWKTYTLQGLKDFIISKNLRAGDTVTFYWKQSTEKFVIEVENNSTKTPTHQA